MFVASNSECARVAYLDVGHPPTLHIYGVDDLVSHDAWHQHIIRHQHYSKHQQHQLRVEEGYADHERWVFSSGRTTRRICLLSTSAGPKRDPSQIDPHHASTPTGPSEASLFPYLA
ncbi:hypothetical protein VFPPC_15535 [Pochonia chlamydosporia 170]|uniref:Uncharacterized protein n=1 Tax=Pochonia chlamydosporia 170 TaxID=1380566 RepID=A0A179FY51_METCM|nr:hypothetical protein VFPPC_15535 [Pochonia chlamydosporia 170]OAQ70110.1 hypothetical protein VFPPC_15535 [Pochonia chlamydosporia 170]